MISMMALEFIDVDLEEDSVIGLNFNFAFVSDRTQLLKLDIDS